MDIANIRGTVPVRSGGAVLVVVIAMGLCALVGGATLADAEFKDEIPILETLSALFFVALLLERGVEVGVLLWRESPRERIERAILGADAAGKVQLEEQLGVHKAETRRFATALGFVVGVLVAAGGVRSLEPLVSSVPVESLGFFRLMDILVTGALIGGGADGIHQLTSVALEFLKLTKEGLGDRRADAAQAGVAPPRLESVQPPTVPPDGGQVTLVLTGSGFTERTVVRIGSADLTPVERRADLLKVLWAPPGSPGAVKVSAVNGSAESAAMQVNVQGQ